MDMSGITINIIPDADSPLRATPSMEAPPPTPARPSRRAILLSASSGSGSGSLEGVPSPWDSGPSSPRDCGSGGGFSRQRRPSWLKIRPSIHLLPGTPANTSQDHLSASFR